MNWNKLMVSFAVTLATGAVLLNFVGINTYAIPLPGEGYGNDSGEVLVSTYESTDTSSKEQLDSVEAEIVQNARAGYSLSVPTYALEDQSGESGQNLAQAISKIQPVVNSEYKAEVVLSSDTVLSLSGGNVASLNLGQAKGGFLSKLAKIIKKIGAVVKIIVNAVKSIIRVVKVTCRIVDVIQINGKVKTICGIFRRFKLIP